MIFLLSELNFIIWKTTTKSEYPKNVVEFFLNDLEWKNEKNTQNLLNEAILISKKDGNNENVKYLTELLEVKNEENLQINSTSKPKM